MLRPFMFLPFHARPCISLDQNFAHRQAMNTVTRLLQDYSWKVVDGFEPKPEPNITKYSRNGVQVISEKRQGKKRGCCRMHHVHDTFLSCFCLKMIKNNNQTSCSS
ncbi:MAG: hypothetical protein BYD32DRAFT_422840 [Podila humilis]|nr:MAG: hypothetical protein BYD32DRAFT_422840 [Podila humilis]